MKLKEISTRCRKPCALSDQVNTSKILRTKPEKILPLFIAPAKEELFLISPTNKNLGPVTTKSPNPSSSPTSKLSPIVRVSSSKSTPQAQLNSNQSSIDLLLEIMKFLDPETVNLFLILDQHQGMSPKRKSVSQSSVKEAAVAISQLKELTKKNYPAIPEKVRGLTDAKKE